MKAKVWVVMKYFEGDPKDEDLEMIEEDLPEVKDGEILAEAELLSVDPYMRLYISRYPLGITMIGKQLAKVVESKHTDYPVGCRIITYVGWRTHTVFVPEKPEYRTVLIPELGDLPKSLALGTLGVPGCTAYFGLTEILHAKDGETLLVNTAAGAVGSVVGQLGKIMGLRVIGSTGSEEKCNWLKEELGFDHVFNYKTDDIDAEIKKGAPKGVDCYFNNVGGDFTAKVLENHMNPYGRVAACGAMSSYEASRSNVPCGPYPWTPIVLKQLKIEGFLAAPRWKAEVPVAVKRLTEWVKEGKLKYREHMTEGFENMRNALYGMLKGENIGKAFVKV